MEQFEYSLEQIEQAARICWEKLQQGHVMAFHGEMGSGKTTLIQTMCRQKHVRENVSSPTFSLINEYTFLDDTQQIHTIYHIDLYRLRSVDEAIRVGVEDCLDAPGICLIEWPELITSLLPDDTIHVYIDILGEKKRRLRITPAP
ncbi:tRNA (adenosine(37)-N6)-threonylcarbamoyltransferase complex ATPase subunit type 1 TsaE [Thermoflavifilum thermophilum]|uniref:tRNA threonylcarbamoyladenosine biosynthesis protein TsaE n=1 Tax=Thermoflavifilum thermophilum TaxID=1393122 RepID=A0A1I7N534_9BACT|nr:tRNA (adenosine(37)-N6)-threonylcarbamoyltransferase complex ATPase subunit type 1 TsaE [Thermoflavifilum thermophilum]SFV29771.1 tRNA threonylcarbamoyladenosine biosynthesis protein TsaE [Thermoflavifilum thermophilum]